LHSNLTKSTFLYKHWAITKSDTHTHEIIISKLPRSFTDSDFIGFLWHTERERERDVVLATTSEIVTDFDRNPLKISSNFMFFYSNQNPSQINSSILSSPFFSFVCFMGKYRRRRDTRNSLITNVTYFPFCFLSKELDVLLGRKY
jgi:hypothetical protein